MSDTVGPRGRVRCSGVTGGRGTPIVGSGWYLDFLDGYDWGLGAEGGVRVSRVGVSGGFLKCKSGVVGMPLP